MQYLSAAASLRLKYVCDRDSEMQNLEICMSGKCKKSIFYFFGLVGVWEVLPLFSFEITVNTSTIRILKAKLGTEMKN